MDPISPLGLLISWVSVLFIGVAFIAATLGIQMLYPITLQSASRLTLARTLKRYLRSPLVRRIYGGLLLGSAMAWISLAVILQSSSHGSDITRIQSLPPSAAGEPSGHLLAPNRTTSTTSTIKAAMHGEELVNSPDGPEFKKLKKHLSRLLLSAPEFDDPAKTVNLNLSVDQYRDTIRYLAEEYPGLLSMVFHRRVQGEAQVVLYYPSIAGEQLLYLPLTGPINPALSQLKNTGE